MTTNVLACVIPIMSINMLVIGKPVKFVNDFGAHCSIKISIAIPYQDLKMKNDEVVISFLPKIGFQLPQKVRSISWGKNKVALGGDLDSLPLKYQC